VDYAFSPAAKAFGAEVRSWIESVLPPDWETRHPPSSSGWMEFQREWDKLLYAQGWGAIFWPAEYGGLDAGPEHRVMFAKVLAEHNAPEGLGKLGKRALAPVLFTYGTAEQKARFLPPMLRGEHFWAQGFSEPDAGSDLAALRTRGTVVGDELVLDGQKVWTSFAWCCEWMSVLVRTSREGNRQQGITFAVLPTDTPGVTIRPIGQINGRSEFSEVFFDAARIPLANVIGQLGDGWTVAKALLEFERGAEQAFSRSGYMRNAVAQTAAELRRAGHTDPPTRARLGRLQAAFIGSEVNSLRLLAGQMDGDAPGDLSAVVKLQQTSDWAEATTEHLRLLGPRAFSAGPDHFERYFTSRSATIAAGASEVQRDIIARRILGLPK
jgi:alkylation response protein AidB-like acyl-CoA dehydrogenase